MIDALNKKYTVENNAIPASFGNDNSTLICILQGRKSRDRYMKKHLENEYNGKYILLLEEELENNEYSNKNEYRYVFHYNVRYAVMANGADMKASNYYIYDRKEDKDYNSDVTTGLFSKMIESYLINLEIVRASNQ